MKVGSICNDSRRWKSVNEEADVEMVGACLLSCKMSMNRTDCSTTSLA